MDERIVKTPTLGQKRAIAGIYLAIFLFAAGIAVEGAVAIALCPHRCFWGYWQ
jgi:hypothetical protein